ncbi:MAG: RluA family pseudouridine synthase [Actinobacteria bacterium]|nr:RluA family pseudouridine synthase [Actinomycetota bacterium]
MDKNYGTFQTGADDAGGRIDVFLSERLEISRSRAQSLIAGGLILINGTHARKNRVLSCGDRVDWEFPEQEGAGVVPEAIEIDIAYEDEHIVVIDKRAGLVMYPGPGHSTGTLLNSLIMKYPEMNDVGGKGRSGIFHRLDKDTSGLVAVARTEEAYQAMVRKMKAREVERKYTALVIGSIPADNGTIDAPVGRSRGDRKKMSVDRYSGKRAVSRFKVTERFPQGFTLLSVSLETGRTHQIRVHFSHIGFPVVGDCDYSGSKAGKELGLDRQFLHASELRFERPISSGNINLKSALPNDLSTVIRALRLNKSKG